MPPAAARSAWDRPAETAPGAAASTGEPRPPLTIRRVLAGERAAPSGRPALAEEALLLVVHDGSGRLIDLAGDVLALSDTGTTLLVSALEGTPTLAELAERYRVPAERLAADRDALLADLVRRRVVSPANAAKARSPGLASRALGALVRVLARAPLRATAAKASRLATLAHVATRLGGWSGAARAWFAAFARQPAAPADPALLDAVDRGVGEAIARHWLNVGCKERALAAWALLSAGGAASVVRLGVDLFPFGLHCWCESGGRLVADRYEGRCDRYTPLLAYGGQALAT
jgi:hypothetical protein